MNTFLGRNNPKDLNDMLFVTAKGMAFSHKLPSFVEREEDLDVLCPSLLLRWNTNECRHRKPRFYTYNNGILTISFALEENDFVLFDAYESFIFNAFSLNKRNLGFLYLSLEKSSTKKAGKIYHIKYQFKGICHAF